MLLKKPLLTELVTYTAVTAVGMVIDLGLAFVLVNLFSVSAVLAGMAGLVMGTVVNYMIHSKVTFRRQNLEPSLAGLFKYAQSCIVGITARLGILVLLTAVTTLNPNLILTLAVGVSFLVNYLTARFYVFHKPKD